EAFATLPVWSVDRLSPLSTPARFGTDPKVTFLLRSLDISVTGALRKLGPVTGTHMSGRGRPTAVAAVGACSLGDRRRSSSIHSALAERRYRISWALRERCNTAKTGLSHGLRVCGGHGEPGPPPPGTPRTPSPEVERVARARRRKKWSNKSAYP